MFRWEGCIFGLKVELLLLARLIRYMRKQKIEKSCSEGSPMLWNPKIMTGDFSSRGRKA